VNLSLAARVEVARGTVLLREPSIELRLFRKVVPHPSVGGAIAAVSRGVLIGTFSHSPSGSF
jgi:hypothetical protein